MSLSHLCFSLVHPHPKLLELKQKMPGSIPTKPGLAGEAADLTTWAQILSAALNFQHTTCSPRTAGRQKEKPRGFKCMAASA